MEHELKGIRYQSEKYAKLTMLINRVNEERLKEAHCRQKTGKAVGTDGMTKEEYGRNLDENIKGLIGRMKSFKYIPQPVRRTYIPKPNGKMRPLGIPAYEDRLVQSVMAEILNDVYEPRFLDCSYGFRPNRCAQQAVLKALEMMNDGHSWVVDIDLAKFFDTVDQDRLMTIFGRTIKDGNVISVVRKFLASGVMIDDEYEDYATGRKHIAAVGEHHA